MSPGRFPAGLLVLSDHYGGYHSVSLPSPATVSRVAERDSLKAVLPVHLSAPLSESEVASAIRSFEQTPFADTLRRILGTVPLDRAPVGAGVAGVYLLAEDRIELSGRPGEFNTRLDLDATIAHEFAHVWQSRNGAPLGFIWSRYNVRAPTGNYAGYSTTSRSEHQADAVAAAFIILRVGASSLGTARSRGAVVRAIGRREPGSIVLARVLLTHPLYAHYRLSPINVDLTPLPIPCAWRLPPSGSFSSRQWSFVEATAPGLLGVVVRHISPVLR